MGAKKSKIARCTEHGFLMWNAEGCKRWQRVGFLPLSRVARLNPQAFLSIANLFVCSEISPSERDKLRSYEPLPHYDANLMRSMFESMEQRNPMVPATSLPLLVPSGMFDLSDVVSQFNALGCVTAGIEYALMRIEIPPDCERNPSKLTGANLRLPLVLCAPKYASHARLMGVFRKDIYSNNIQITPA